jgi:hypothetical protein
LEAENFFELKDFKVEYKNDRQVSQRICIVPVSAGKVWIRTDFDEPYTSVSGIYNVEIRYYDGIHGQSELQFYISGNPVGNKWTASMDDNNWKSYCIKNVKIHSGDELKLVADLHSDEFLKLDYIQLDYQAPDKKNDFQINSNYSVENLDDADALPGQIIVAGSNPGYLKYNGGGPAFLCGPDNPEEFLYRGILNNDGTRSGGGQEEMIERMAEAGVNAFHCLIFRMQRCNIKNEGDDQHCPFTEHDPSKGLNQEVLNQWNDWLDLFEKNGINVHLEFYNDATDVEKMGWILDENGNLHPDEHRFIELKKVVINSPGTGLFILKK